MMATVRRAAGQQQSLLPAVIAGGVAAFGAGIWYGFPGPAAVVAALLVWAWTEPAPLLTGPKKVGSSTPTAQGPGEEKKLVRYQTAQQARFAPVTSAWIPGWPLQGSCLLGLVLAAFVCTLPVQKPWMMAASAIGMFTGVAGFAAARRQVTGNPGSTLKTLFELAGERRTLIKLVAFTLGGALLGAGVGQALNMALSVSPAGAAPFPWLLTVAAATAGAGVGLSVPWRAEALKDWRELCAVREEWRPRWPLIKFDPEPVATETTVVGPFRFTTFDCQGAKGSQDLFNLAGKLDAVLPSGTGYAICPSPMEFKTGPDVGTIHPSKAQIVTWDQTEWPDVSTAECDQQIAAAACQIALSAGSLANAMTPVIATEVVAVHTDESPTALWMANITMSTSAAGSARAGGIGSGGLTAGMLGWTALDHRQQTVKLYFGDPDADIDPQTEKTLNTVTEEDMWTAAWLASLKTSVNPPVLQPAQSRTATLASGAEIERTAFAVRLGVDVSTMMLPQIERNLSTAILGTTFVTITGWTEGVAGRPGERHKAAFAVYRSKDARLPSSPDQMAPRPGSQAPHWVMVGFFNHAFDALRLPRPEVVTVKALTEPKSRGHIWEVRLRLYGGVTFGDVRTQAERLRQAMGCGWLRVQDAEDGCVVFCGAPWRKVQMANPRRDIERVTRLDWTQAMTDAKVTGAGNRVPELTASAALPHNDQVQVLDFDLPPGVDREMLQKALPKLRTSSGNEYLELRKSSKGASAITILACEHDPMPTRAGYEPATVEASTAIPFCVGVEGEPLDFDPVVAIHLLVLGGAGSGKSATLQTLITGALLRGWDLYITDPVKGGADFRFAEPWARAFTTELFDAAAMMRAVYAEVVRRKNLNSQRGVGSFRDLPDGERPPYLLLVMDEFTSLMGLEMVDRTPSDDAEIEADRQLIMARNAARREIGMLAGKVAREARSAGVVLLLATQKLMSDDLDKIGSKDIKDNMARLLLGKTTYGAKMSGLISPDEAADLGEIVPKGRGLYETPMMYGSPVQIWYAPSAELASVVAAARAPLPASEKVDLSPFDRRPKPDEGPAIQAVSIDDVAPLVEVIDLGVVDVGLDELEEAVRETAPAFTLAELEDPNSGGAAGVDPAAELERMWDETHNETDSGTSTFTVDESDQTGPSAVVSATDVAELGRNSDETDNETDSWSSTSSVGEANRSRPPEMPVAAAGDDPFAGLEDLWAARERRPEPADDPFAQLDWTATPEADDAPASTVTQPIEMLSDDEFGPDPSAQTDQWQGLSGWEG